MWIYYVVLVVLCSVDSAVSRASNEQRKYRTAYACEGSSLSLTCDNNEVINLVRANYGRFSITICNEHGDTDWSVNCMSHRSLRVLHSKCNQQTNCTVLASTSVFGDPCPGTFKYLEAHYQCIQAVSTSSTARPRPPWFSSVGPALWSTLSYNSTTTTTTTTPSTTTAESTTTTTTTTEASVPVAGTSNKNDSASSTVMSTTSTTSAPILVELTEVTVLVPDFPGKNRKDHPPVPTSAPMVPHEEEDEETDGHDEDDTDEQDGEVREAGQAETTPTSASPSATTRRIPLHPGAEGKTPLLPPSDEYSYCPPTVTRGLYWNWTKVGDAIVQPCPGGATGYARWHCTGSNQHAERKGAESVLGGASPASWSPAAPDLSECKSVWLTSLESRIGEGDSVISISNDLAQVTSSKTLYGGDMAAAAKLLRQMALKMAADLQAFPDWRQREAIVTELVQSVMRAGSNLLGSSQSLAWRDLGLSSPEGGLHSPFRPGSKDSHARDASTDLLTSLEENAFLLANTISRQKSVWQAFDNILMAVRVMDTRNVNELSFPSDEELQVWKSKEDSITLPAEALLANSDGGLVRVVYFAYEHMEDILSPYEETRHPHSSGSLSIPREGIIIQGNVTRIVNSRVISASLGKGRHIQLPKPVTIRLKHLRQDNVSNPTCVFWDYTVSAWSDEGCRVLTTNRSHTVCRCDHLTNFAILMDLHSTQLTEEHQVALAVITYVGCSVSIVCLLFSVIIFIFFRGLKSDRTTIHKNLCLCLLIAEIIFLAGINQTHDKIVCGLVAGLLHYFFLCAFMWMFLEGFQLYVMLVEVFESEKSRIKWYYICGYGIPTIIVAISCVVDPLSYGTSSYCWLRADNYFIFSFVGPVIAILIANFVFLSLAIYVMCRHRSTTAVMKTKEQTRLDNARVWIRSAFALVILLGLTWTFGLLYLNQATVAMAYIFTILNSLQGFFIFFFHCVQNDKVRKEVAKYLRRNGWLPECISSSSTHTGAGTGNLSTGKERASFYGNNTQSTTTTTTGSSSGGGMAPSSATQYLQQPWSGATGHGNGNLEVGMVGCQPSAPAVTMFTELSSNNNGSMRVSKTLRASGRDQRGHTLINCTNDLENTSYKSYGRDSGNGGSEQDDSSPRFVQTVPASRAAAPQQVAGLVSSMGRRGHYPHPVPNPALAEGAAMDAQLIAQFRDGKQNTSLRLNPHIRTGKRSNRAASPWNHTYMEIDMRSRSTSGLSGPLSEENELNPEHAIIDPVYEEIERGDYMCRPGVHYQQGSDLSDEDGRRQNSDVSRQSSRSYGDNRPLIPPLHHANHAHNHDLLTTISCAFNSPHLRPKHRHPHPESVMESVSFDGMARLYGDEGFVQHPELHKPMLGNPNMERSLPLRESAHRSFKRNAAAAAAAAAPNPIPYTEC